MQISIDYKEIEALIKAKTGFSVVFECVSNDEIKCHIQSIGFLGSSSKFNVEIDRSYQSVNGMKLSLKGNLLSNFVIQKILNYISSRQPEALTAEKGRVMIVSLDKITQLKSLLDSYTLNYVTFQKSALKIEFLLSS